MGKLSSSKLRLIGGGVVAAAVLGFVVLAPESADAGEIVVYKLPTCGCCGEWVEHLRDNGFDVAVHETADMGAVKAEHGVQAHYGSCHTALIDGYVVEGHVPASTIKRLLAERPDVAGIAVPGMPIGSPGMEMPGRAADRYNVLTFDSEGRTGVYEQH